MEFPSNYSFIQSLLLYSIQQLLPSNSSFCLLCLLCLVSRESVIYCEFVVRDTVDSITLDGTLSVTQWTRPCEIFADRLQKPTKNIPSFILYHNLLVLYKVLKLHNVTFAIEADWKTSLESMTCIFILTLYTGNWIIASREKMFYSLPLL